MPAKGSPALYIRLRSVNSGDQIAPPELRDLLVRRATEDESSLTDVVVGILGDKFGVPVERGKRATQPLSDRDFLVVRLPQRLDKALRMQAARRDTNRQREAMIALCQFFGLDVPPPPRRGPIPRAA